MAEEQESQEQQKGGNKTMLFVIIGAVLVLIIVGVVVIMLMSGGGGEEEEAKTPAKQEQTKTASKKPTSGDSASLMNIGPILSITPKEPLIINLSTQGGREAFLSIHISIGLSSEKFQVEVERKLDIIKDTFINVLSTKTPEELKTTKGMNRALEEARSRINEYMVDGEVTHVFRTNSVIQKG